MLRRLTIARTLTIVLWLLLPVIAVRVQNDTDVWWQLRSGEQNLSAGRIVQEETFSYTFAGSTARIQHEWLGQPVLVAFWSLLGHAGLSLYAVVCAMTGMAFVYRALAGGPYLRAFLLVLGAFSASIFWGARPLMLSFALAAVTLWIVYGYHRDGSTRRLWILPPMFALWGNLHGGWPQGALILLAAAAGMALNWLVFKHVSPRRAIVVADADSPLPEGEGQGVRATTRASLRPLLVFLIPCILAAILIPLLNPYGADMLRVPIDTVGFDFQPLFIEEWRPPSLSRPEMWPFFALLALTVLTMALDWRRADFVEIVMVAGTAYMALTSARHIAFFSTVALIPLSIHAAALGAGRGWRIRPTTRVTPARARINVLLIALIAFASLMYLVVRLAPVNVEIGLRTRLPVDAVEAMRELQPPQPLLNSWNFGGYLIYFLRDYPVFIDGRADLYRDFTWTYIDILSAKPVWRDEFAKWGIRSVLIEPHAPIADALRVEPGWSVVYEDDVAVLFVRDGP